MASEPNQNFTSGSGGGQTLEGMEKRLYKYSYNNNVLAPVTHVWNL